MSEFLPHLESLRPAQMRLWAELSEIPKDFVLYGGTALALHLGHRDSADFDFFGSRTFDVRALETGIRLLAGARIVQRSPLRPWKLPGASYGLSHPRRPSPVRRASWRTR